MKNLVLVFTRNPELGKVKTRLAASIGDQNALEIYTFLMQHTKEILLKVKSNKRVLYSEQINTNDIWDNAIFDKKVQAGNDLGERMKKAFIDGFASGYEKIVIIGTDLYDLEVSDIEMAFEKLESNDVIIGPAEDGGYYLLGLKQIPNNIFENKNWSSETVFEDTINDIQHLKYSVLKTKNDIDTVEDIMNIEEFKRYIK
jgi:uncharacterized protein